MTIFSDSDDCCIVPPPPNTHVVSAPTRRLMAMGFTQEQSETALRRSNGNESIAVQFILDDAGYDSESDMAQFANLLGHGSDDHYGGASSSAARGPRRPTGAASSASRRSSGAAASSSKFATPGRLNSNANSADPASKWSTKLKTTRGSAKRLTLKPRTSSRAVTIERGVKRSATANSELSTGASASASAAGAVKSTRVSKKVKTTSGWVPPAAVVDAETLVKMQVSNVGDLPAWKLTIAGKPKPRKFDLEPAPAHPGMYPTLPYSNEFVQDCIDHGIWEKGLRKIFN